MADQGPTYLTVPEFEELLVSESLPTLVERHLLSGLPYVFRDKPENLDLLRNHLSERLECSPADIHVVGSSRTGFALNPDRYPREFGPESDIDIVIISAEIFDRYWHTFLNWNYPRRYELPYAERRWAWRRQDDLWWGWFRPTAIRFKGLRFPDVLKPARDLSTAWFDAFQSLSTLREFASYEFRSRLYRTRELATLYHANGLRKLRTAVKAREGG